MYYDDEYTEQDAQRDGDAWEAANEDAQRDGDAWEAANDDGRYIADFVWTDKERRESEKYLMIGGVFADDAGPISSVADLESPESELEYRRRAA